MSLNVKDERAHRLAREVADLTGESMTEAVTIALRDGWNDFSGLRVTTSLS
jgi:antitoxin VapB